jgi:predicted transcriptional regulator
MNDIVMNFNIYLDNVLGAALKRLARRRKMTRNALIREAVQELVNKETRSQEWSAEVMEWQGDTEFAPFESHRAQLVEPTEDPLA